jgi:protein O-mannosyl-transferase
VNGSFRHGRETAVCLAILLLTAAVFLPVAGHRFITFDDDAYVTENSHVREGLTREGVIWAFTAFHSANWHPLTWLSHMLDVSLFGLDPAGHHLVNLALHILGALLLFLVLRLLAGDVWPAAFTAFLFAVHPLHVESVAWVAERKDVLAGVFFMLTLLAWLRYLRRPGIGRYLATALVFMLGLMAKPMLVTLPLVLLLLDGWPLGRFAPGRARALVVEKAPLLALSAASSVLTWLAQEKGEALRQLENVSMGLKVSNALLSAVTYLVKAVAPRNLSIFYPFPEGGIPAWKTAGALALLAAVTAATLVLRRRAPWLALGWGWYLVTLLPVIGLVQAGSQAMADRYTYLPLVGPFAAVAWGMRAPAWRRRIVPATAAMLLVIVLALLARRQVGYWTDSATLYGRALALDPGNWLAHANLGGVLMDEGRLDEALDQFGRVISLKPGNAEARFNTGYILHRRGRYDEAVQWYLSALGVKPDFAGAWNNIGTARDAQGRRAEALEAFRRAVEIDPDLASAHYNLGARLLQEGRIDEARRHLEEALRLDPRDSDARRQLSLIN